MPIMSVEKPPLLLMSVFELGILSIFSMAFRVGTGFFSSIRISSSYLEASYSGGCVMVILLLGLLVRQILKLYACSFLSPVPRSANGSALIPHNKPDEGSPGTL